MAKPHCLKRHFKRCGSNYCEVYYQNNILAERNRVLVGIGGFCDIFWLWFLESRTKWPNFRSISSKLGAAGAKRILKFCLSFQGFEVLWFFRFSMVIPLVVDKKFFTGRLLDPDRQTDQLSVQCRNRTLINACYGPWVFAVREIGSTDRGGINRTANHLAQYKVYGV